HRGYAARKRRRGAGLDRLVLFSTRLAQMDVHVDQARHDDQPGGVNRAVGEPFGLGPQTGDAVVADPEVRHLVEVLSRIDDSAVTDEKVHGRESYICVRNSAAAPRGAG